MLENRLASSPTSNKVKIIKLIISLSRSNFDPKKPIQLKSNSVFQDKKAMSSSCHYPWSIRTASLLTPWKSQSNTKDSGLHGFQGK